MGKNQWVVKRGNEWAVKGEGNERATSIHFTQGEAKKAAKQIAINQGTEVIVQGRAGKIRSKDSFGPDPCPPKDEEH